MANMKRKPWEKTSKAGAFAVVTLLTFLLGEKTKCAPFARFATRCEKLANLRIVEERYASHLSMKSPLFEGDSFLLSREDFGSQDSLEYVDTHKWSWTMSAKFVYCQKCYLRWTPFRAIS